MKCVDCRRRASIYHIYKTNDRLKIVTHFCRRCSLIAYKLIKEKIEKGEM